MKRFVIYICFGALVVSCSPSPEPQSPSQDSNQNPNVTPQLNLDTADDSDVFAIQLDTSAEEEKLEMQDLDNLQKKIQQKKERQKQVTP